MAEDKDYLEQEEENKEDYEIQILFFIHIFHGHFYWL